MVDHLQASYILNNLFLYIEQFSRKDQGIYKAVLGDDRGKDTSVFDISGKGTLLIKYTHLVASCRNQMLMLDYEIYKMFFVLFAVFEDIINAVASIAGMVTHFRVYNIFMFFCKQYHIIELNS